MSSPPADFGALLLSGNFSADNLQRFSLAQCLDWLSLRDDEIEDWIDEFGRRRANLPKALTDMRKSVVEMYTRITWLCSGRQCYLAFALNDVPAKTRAYYKEFTESYHATCDAFDEYTEYAEHHKSKVEQKEISDAQKNARSQADIRKDLFGALSTMKVALAKLTGSLANAAVRPPGPAQSRSA